MCWQNKILIVSKIPCNKRHYTTANWFKRSSCYFIWYSQIRKTSNIIEKKGIELALDIMKKSNLILNLCENGGLITAILKKFV